MSTPKTATEIAMAQEMLRHSYEQHKRQMELASQPIMPGQVYGRAGYPDYSKYPPLSRPEPVKFSYTKEVFDCIPTSNAGELINALLCRARLEGNDVDRDSTVKIEIRNGKVEVKIEAPPSMDISHIAGGYSQLVAERLDYIVSEMFRQGGDPEVQVFQNPYKFETEYSVRDKLGNVPTKKFCCE